MAGVEGGSKALESPIIGRGASSSSSPPPQPPATESAPALAPVATSGGASSSTAPPPLEAASRLSGASKASFGDDGFLSDGNKAEIPVFCKCGKKADQLFLSALLMDLEVYEDDLCRDCKGFRLLEERVEVDKYCYSGWLFSRRKKLMKLSKDRKELLIWPLHRSTAWQVSVPVHDLLGVVFGAYTCTFKKQSANNMPPHWASFSVIGRERSYDFAARDPQVVECCVRSLQHLLWDGRCSSGALVEKDKRPAHVDLIYPELGAFEPWPLGFFLWMRLRFRLQEEAQKRTLYPDHMLWMVFMRCAFLSTSEVTKARFIDMAERLQQEHNFTPCAGSNEMRDLSTKIQFQKEREMDIVKDRYECRIDTFLPSAPSAVVGIAGEASERPSRRTQTDCQMSSRTSNRGLKVAKGDVKSPASS